MRGTRMAGSTSATASVTAGRAGGTGVRDRSGGPKEANGAARGGMAAVGAGGGVKIVRGPEGGRGHRAKAGDHPAAQSRIGAVRVAMANDVVMTAGRRARRCRG